MFDWKEIERLAKEDWHIDRLFTRGGRQTGKNALFAAMYGASKEMVGKIIQVSSKPLALPLITEGEVDFLKLGGAEMPYGIYEGLAVWLVIPDEVEQEVARGLGLVNKGSYIIEKVHPELSTGVIKGFEIPLCDFKPVRVGDLCTVRGWGGVWEIQRFQNVVDKTYLLLENTESKEVANHLVHPDLQLHIALEEGVALQQKEPCKVFCRKCGRFALESVNLCWNCLKEEED